MTSTVSMDIIPNIPADPALWQFGSIPLVLSLHPCQSFSRFPAAPPGHPELTPNLLLSRLSTVIVFSGQFLCISHVRGNGGGFGARINCNCERKAVHSVSSLSEIMNENQFQRTQCWKKVFSSISITDWERGCVMCSTSVKSLPTKYRVLPGSLVFCWLIQEVNCKTIDVTGQEVGKETVVHARTE